MSRKNPRFRLCKVHTIVPSPYVKEIMLNTSINSKNVIDKVSDSSFNIRKNSDDNTALIQKDLVTSTNRLESLIEKVLYLSVISIIISAITLCIC